MRIFIEVIPRRVSGVFICLSEIFNADEIIYEVVTDQIVIVRTTEMYDSTDEEDTKSILGRTLRDYYHLIQK
jgi:hypothetical protein